jgi:hypothetical protein
MSARPYHLGPQDALDRNVEIQNKKKSDYDERVAAAHVRAAEKSVVVLEVVKKQAEDRKKKEDNRYKVSQGARLPL